MLQTENLNLKKKVIILQKKPRLAFYRKAIENGKKTVAKLTSENYQRESSFLIHLLTASKILTDSMFFSFVSFINNRGFFLTCLENIVYDDVCDNMMTSEMT